MRGRLRMAEGVSVSLLLMGCDRQQLATCWWKFEEGDLCKLAQLYLPSRKAKLPKHKNVGPRAYDDPGLNLLLAIRRENKLASPLSPSASLWLPPVRARWACSNRNY